MRFYKESWFSHVEPVGGKVISRKVSRLTGNNDTYPPRFKKKYIASFAEYRWEIIFCGPDTQAPAVTKDR